MSVENNFVMTDQDFFGNPCRFEVIEDESGDIFWAYGHVDPVKFIAEVNRWLMHVRVDITALIVDITGVEHRHAFLENDDDEKFQILPQFNSAERRAEVRAFPVTRLIL